jgi:hypothetical protein
MKFDIKLSKEERLKEVNEYFKYYTPYHEYIDEKFNVHPKQSDALSHDDKTCKELESIANYLLYSGESNNKKDVEYNFYTERQLKEKLNKDASYEEVIEGLYNNTDDVNTINFILENKNYKKAIEQKIFKSDMDIPVIKKYEDYKLMLLMKLNGLRNTNHDKALQRKIVKQIKSIKTDQIICKDAIKGTIYFKSPLHDSTCIDYDQFDFLEHKHVKQLLNCTNNNVMNDLGCLVSDINYILDKLNLNVEELQILNLSRHNKTQQQIADKANCTQPYVNKILTRIASKVVKYYFKMFEDWYYLVVSKGNYKVCLKCGEIKLATKSYFDKKNDNKDGFDHRCKVCVGNRGK